MFSDNVSISPWTSRQSSYCLLRQLLYFFKRDVTIVLSPLTTHILFRKRCDNSIVTLDNLSVLFLFLMYEISILNSTSQVDNYSCPLIRLSWSFYYTEKTDKVNNLCSFIVERTFFCVSWRWCLYCTRQTHRFGFYGAIMHAITTVSM
jgi:hypothetical protein